MSEHLHQRLSAERNTSDSDSVAVSAGDNGRDNGEGGGDALTSPVQVTTHSSITLSTHMCVHVCVFTVYVCMLGVCIDMNPVIYSVSVIDWSGLSSFLPLTVGCSSVTTGRSCRYRWRNWWVWLRPVHSRFPPPLQT